MKQLLLACVRVFGSGQLKPRRLFLVLLSFSFLPAFAQQKVTGTITSDGQPVADVTVRVKGSNQMSLTDAQGVFSIDVPANAVLVVSHVGYVEVEVPVNGQSSLDISLTATANSMSEVVVVGYSSQKKATLTGSISTVKGADIVKSPQANVSNSLAGRFSGVILNNRSGEPGYDGSNVTIRGQATTGNKDVLIVVDGIPGQIGGLERLNPNDIESISVLKDASASIYGSRAANGVILVTTKQGKSGKPVINASFNQGFSSPTRLPKVADAPMYAAIANEIAYYNNKAGGMNQQYSDEDIQKFANGSDPLNYPNTNWANAALQKTALQNQANISVSGGSENVRYYFSLGSLFQDGLYKNGATKYKQYSFRSNIDANITKDFKVSLYLSGREENRQFPTVGAGDVFRSIYRAFPIVAAFYPNGLPTYGIEGNNPALMATTIGGINNNPKQVFNGILKGNYVIPGVKGLSVDGSIAIDKSWNFSKSFAQPYSLYLYDKATEEYNLRVVGGLNRKATLTQSQENQTQITSLLKVNYQRDFGNHALNGFVAYEQSEVKRETFGAFRENFPTILTPELSQGGPAAIDRNNSGNSYRFTRNSYIGKIGYNYDERYLLDVQARIDGTSTFAAGKRFGFFPSVSGGWVISKESFMQDAHFIQNLKLRASYGLLGNDNVGLFQYLTNYQFYNQLVLGNTIVPGLDLIKLANPAITWERAKKMDIGLEASFLNGFNLEFIYFKQNRNDILATRNASIPFVTGIVNPFPTNDNTPLVPSENIGKVDNNGIEATLGYSKRKGDFSWGVSGNITYAKSKIVFIDEAAGVLPHQKQTGRPLNTYLLYNATGIFRSQDDIDKNPHLSVAQPGDLIYQDFDGDGFITANDRVRSKYGNIPEITYGILLNGEYKNFDISMVFAGQSHVSQYVLPESGTVGNFYSSWADNRWSPSNVNGSFPRVDTRASASVNGGQYSNTFWLNDASFLRLKNIELGYNFSPEWLGRIRMNAARLYVNGFNLFTITKVKDYDPEGDSGSGQFYPQQRIINVGVNLRF